MSGPICSSFYCGAALAADPCVCGWIKRGRVSGALRSGSGSGNPLLGVGILLLSLGAGLLSYFYSRRGCRGAAAVFRVAF